MLKLRWLAGALALLFISTSADAAGTACTTRGELMAFLAERFPLAKVAGLSEGDARLFMASLNRLPPVTTLSADEVVIADVGEAETGLRVALFEGGCMTRMGLLPRPVVRQILAAIARGTA